MNPIDQSRRARFQPSGGRGCALLAGVVLLIAAGCEGLPSRSLQHDPLLGSQAPPPPVAASGGSAAPAAQTTASTDPPALPAAYTAAGPAAVASGEMAAPDKGRDLRISGDTFTPTNLSNNGAARGVAPAVQVGNPVPATNDSTSHLAPAAASAAPAPPPASAAPVTNFEQAQRLLNQYGVSWQRLDKFDGKWKFECSIPNPTNPSVGRRYTTTKAFPDEMSAIREVISQIEQKRP